MKNQKGITLVALILIVVLLIILAGISVSLVLTEKAVDENNAQKGQTIQNAQPLEDDLIETPDEESQIIEDEVVENEVEDDTTENEVVEDETVEDETTEDVVDEEVEE